MGKFTVCLYDGDVEYIDNVLEISVVEAENIYSVDYMNTCFDPIVYSENETTPPHNYSEWRYRDGGKVKCYYTRSLLYSDKMIVVDFGSYNRFILVIAGELSADDAKNTLNNYNYNV